MIETNKNYAMILAIVLGAAATLSGVGLARFSYSVMLPELIHQGWFTETQAVFLGAANLLGYTLGAVFASMLRRRWGGTAIIRIASAAVFITFICSAWPTDIALYSLWRFASGMAGGVLMATAPPVMLSMVPIESKRWASSCIFVGIGLGISTSALITPLMEGYDLMYSWLLLSALSMIPFLLLQFLWKGEQQSTTHYDSSSAKASSKGLHNRHVVLLLLLIYGLDAFGYIPHTVYWVDYLNRSANYSLDQSAAQWALFGLGAILGPFLVGLVANRVGWHRTLVLALLTKSAAIALPLLSSSLPVISASSILVGAMVPGIVAAMAGRLSEVVSADMQIKVWGLATATFASVQGISAYLVAYVYTQPNGPITAFAMGALALMFAAGIALIQPVVAPTHHRQENGAGRPCGEGGSIHQVNGLSVTKQK